MEGEDGRERGGKGKEGRKAKAGGEGREGKKGRGWEGIDLPHGRLKTLAALNSSV